MAQQLAYKINTALDTVQTQHPSTSHHKEAVRRPSKKVQWSVVFFVMLNLGMLLAIIFTQNIVDQRNTQLHKIQQETEQQQLLNEATAQEIQELMRYDRVMELSAQYGLKMNEENVRNVTE